MVNRDKAPHLGRLHPGSTFLSHFGAPMKALIGQHPSHHINTVKVTVIWVKVRSHSLRGAAKAHFKFVEEVERLDRV